MIECVPNFSEGRDKSVVSAIVEAIRNTPGILLLGWESDGDHNRSVVTFAGPEEAVVEGAIRGAGRAAEFIDLSRHHGQHPRVGAADVVPFVPLEDATLEDCVRAAHHAGRKLWERHRIPVYFYEAAALTPGRERLEKVRRREFDGLPPDIGDVSAHPTWGASMVGARSFLIAYNVLLDTADLSIARAIAKKIRASSGGFPNVKAIGLYLAAEGRAQISMNLTNFLETPLDQVMAAIDSEAERLGTRALAGELIGFVAKRAYEIFPKFFERAANFEPCRIIENRIDQLLNLK